MDRLEGRVHGARPIAPSANVVSKSEWLLFLILYPIWLVFTAIRLRLFYRLR